MRNLMLLVAGFLLETSILAQGTDGPFSGGTFSNAPLAGSSVSWTNSDSAAGSDNQYVRFGSLPNPAGTHTDYLVATNFGFNLPPSAIVSGIVVYVERADPNARTNDYSIRILKAGVIGSTDRAGGGGFYSTTDAYQSFGNSGDIWGETWTAADINDPNFGVAIAAQRTVAGGTTRGRVDHIQITVFYDFMVTPVNLISFAAAKKDKDIEVKWTTAEEVRMDHYEIERSADGRNFTTIGAVNSGQQLVQFDYSFLDKNPFTGTSYYRLKMVGTAGDIRYSKIVSLQSAGQYKIQLYPNPLRYGQQLTLVNPGNEQLTIAFYNVSGQRIAKAVTADNTIPFQGFQNQQGILFYKVFEKNGNLAGTGKLLVQ